MERIVQKEKLRLPRFRRRNLRTGARLLRLRRRRANQNGRNRRQRHPPPGGGVRTPRPRPSHIVPSLTPTYSFRRLSIRMSTERSGGMALPGRSTNPRRQLTSRSHSRSRSRSSILGVEGHRRTTGPVAGTGQPAPAATQCAHVVLFPRENHRRCSPQKPG